MTLAMHQRIGISNQRGFWLRCFLGAASLAASIAILPPSLARSQGIVDCVYPGHVTVSHVAGQVFDPFGVVVPGVVVTLVDEHGSSVTVKTDTQGRFQIPVLSGAYSFKAVFPMFQTSQTVLNVDKDIVGLARSNNLYVILGLDRMYCAWVTTSKKEFQENISNNKKRAKESAQRNAPQK